MVPVTRRTLLSGAVGLTTALTGCSGQQNSSDGATRTAPRDDGPDGLISGATTDPETLLVRIDTDRPPLWLAKSDEETTGRPTANRRDRWRDHIIVDDPARVDRISVADAVPSDQVESFFTATDFDAETVYIEMGNVRECFRLELCHIDWSSNEISTDYTRRTRPYTEQCPIDGWVIETRLIRIPDAINADDVSGYSSSIGSGECDPQHGRPAGENGSGTSPGNETTTRTETTTSDSQGDQ